MYVLLKMMSVLKGCGYYNGFFCYYVVVSRVVYVPYEGCAMTVSTSEYAKFGSFLYAETTSFCHKIPLFLTFLVKILWTYWMKSSQVVRHNRYRFRIHEHTNQKFITVVSANAESRVVTLPTISRGFMRLRTYLGSRRDNCLTNARM